MVVQIYGLKLQHRVPPSDEEMKMQIKNIYGDVLFEVPADTLRNADLRNAILRNAILRIADLRNADLLGANLAGANLSGANLSGANLQDANLSAANLSGANLSGANLQYAYLEGTNLRSANLADTNLTVINLTDADLAGAKLTRTSTFDNTKGYTVCGIGDQWEVNLLCFNSTPNLVGVYRYFRFEDAHNKVNIWMMGE